MAVAASASMPGLQASKCQRPAGAGHQSEGRAGAGEHTKTYPQLDADRRGRGAGDTIGRLKSDIGT